MSDTGDEHRRQEVVRPFVVTRGRTRSRGEELPPETLVATPERMPVAGKLAFEQQRIVELCTDDPLSIAELAAELRLPTRAAQVLVGDMVADGLLEPQEVVAEIDLDLLDRIRRAVAEL